jgi:hypothetical protein
MINIECCAYFAMAMRGVERGTACSEKVKILFEWFIFTWMVFLAGTHVTLFSDKLP